MPAPGASGTATFEYTVDDGAGGADDTVVRVEVAVGNDPPDAIDDTATTARDTSVVVPVLANDTDPDGDALRIVGVGVPNSGTAAPPASRRRAGRR